MKKENSLALGTAFGVATANLALWLSLGIAIGAATGTTLVQKHSKANDDKS